MGRNLAQIFAGFRNSVLMPQAKALLEYEAPELILHPKFEPESQNKSILIRQCGMIMLPRMASEPIGLTTKAVN